jgi:L-fuconolactonase
VCTLAATYGQVRDLADTLTDGLSDHERAEVLEGTATRVYRL